MAAKRQPKPSNSRNSTYAQMQLVLDSQEAANEQTRQAMAALKNAMDMFAMAQSSSVNATNPNFPVVPVGNGNRPVMNQNQTGRPNHNSYDVDPLYGGTGTSYGRGLRGVRGAAVRGLENRFGVSSGPQYSKILDDQGNHVGYKAVDPQSGATTYHPTWGVSDSDLAAASTRSVISRGLSGAAEGGLLGGARAVPYVGAAVVAGEAAYEGATFVADQRAKNAQYQSILGGSNASGLGQRFDQLGYQVSNLFSGGLTFGQSSQAFQGVTALGYQGAQRSSDLNFIQSNYLQFGTSVADSLKLIQIAASDLNESLSGLQTGLQSVRDAATSTGQSAQYATQQYQSAYGQLAQSYYGQGVGSVAAGVTTNLLRQGRATGVSSLGLLTNQANIPRLAASVGKTPTQFADDIQQNSPLVYKALRIQAAQTTAPYINDPNFQSVFNRDILRRPGSNGSLSRGIAGIRNESTGSQQDDITSMAHQIAQSGFNANGLVASLNAHGYRQANGQQFSYDDVEPAIEYALRNRLGLNNFDSPTRRDHPGAARHFTGPAGDKRRGDDGYTIDPTRSGVNPTIDALSKKYGDNRRFIIKDGKYGNRVVSLKEAKEIAPDQLALGTAKLASSNETIKQMGTVPVQSHYTYLNQYRKEHPNDRIINDITNRSTATYGIRGIGRHVGKNADDPTGESLSQYNRHISKDINKGAGKGGHIGTVTIAPSQELQQLLLFNASGNINLATGAASDGTTPVPGQ